MNSLKQFEVWFVTGSQHLYGPKAIEQVGEHSKLVVQALAASTAIPVTVDYKPVLTTPEAIRALCLEANAAENCIGLIAWMHTFSPATMWIGGPTGLRQPFFYLPTHFQPDNPPAPVYMGFINTNPSGP